MSTEWRHLLSPIDRFKERHLMNDVDERIDTVTRSVLGLTVNCEH
jgi:hypothetical protein